MSDDDYRRLIGLRDDRFDAVHDPALTKAMAVLRGELVACLRRGADRIDQLPDSGPGARARRTAQTEWLREAARYMADEPQ